MKLRGLRAAGLGGVGIEAFAVLAMLGALACAPAHGQTYDVVISNGVLNLMPDKPAALAEMARVLKPGGRLQIGDILVDRPVPESAKRQIDLWTG